MTGVTGAAIWLVAAIVLFVIESLTVQLVCVWFALGAFAAMAASLFGATETVQIVLFFAVSVAILLVWRPFLKKRIMPRKTATNADAIVGQTGVIIEEVDNALQTGRVSVSGIDWTARSEDGGIIPARQSVTVKRIDGIKLIVEPAEKTAPEKELQGV